MKIYLMTDMEGVAGVATHMHHSYPDGKYFDLSKKLLTHEVNAAIDGLLEQGVTEVLVADGHGPGAIDFELLHPKAHLLHGRPITKQQLLEPIWNYDALAFIGQHAKAGRRHGNQNHTFNSRDIDWMCLNGREIGEIGILSLWAGIGSIPVIFLSGDEEACKEAEEEIPGIVTAAVKKGISSNVEITLSAPEARALIRQKIGMAVQQHRKNPLAPTAWKPPFTLQIRWKTTELADAMQHQTNCLRVDSQTVAFESHDILDVLLHRHQGFG